MSGVHSRWEMPAVLDGTVLSVESYDPNIGPWIAIFVQADLPVPARREHQEPFIERNIAKRFGPVILGIPYGAVVSKSPDSGGIEIRFDAEDLAVVGLFHFVLAVGTVGRTAHRNVVVEAPASPSEVDVHPPEVRQRQRVDEWSDVRKVTERPTVGVHLVDGAGRVD